MWLADRRRQQRRLIRSRHNEVIVSSQLWLDTPPAEQQLEAAPKEPPVLARLVVEIRSDGVRTVARGALEDILSGETVAIEARGTTPMSLAWSLVESLVRVPSFARSAVSRLKHLPSRARAALRPNDDHKR